VGHAFDFSSVAARRWRRHGAASGCTAAVELGCGVGVAGLALAFASATAAIPPRLLLTDVDPRALRRVQHNAAINRLGHVHAVALPWGRAEAQALRERESASFTHAAPLVFAADVVYDEACFLPLVRPRPNSTGSGVRVVSLSSVAPSGRRLHTRGARFAPQLVFTTGVP
jgi:predicted nicotinamide N-methyase